MSPIEVFLVVSLVVFAILLGASLTYAALIRQRILEATSALTELAPAREVQRGTQDDYRDPNEPDAIPMDPNNPPIPRVFNPKRARDPQTYPICACHDQHLVPGDEILWWPLPDSDGVLIFHRDYIHGMAQT